MSKPDDHQARLRAQYVLQVRKGLPAYNEPRIATGLPDNAQLLCGYEFTGSDALADAQAYLFDLLRPACPHKWPTRFEAALEAAYRSPSIGTFRVLARSAELALARDEGPDRRDPLLRETATVVDAVGLRATIYAAALGCARSKATCAVHAMQIWTNDTEYGTPSPETWGAILSMLAWMQGARWDAPRPGDPVEPGLLRHNDLIECRYEARKAIRLAGVVLDAIDAGPVEEGEIGVPYVSKPTSGLSLDELRHLERVSEDRGEIRDTGPEPDPDPVPKPPGLVVVEPPAGGPPKKRSHDADPWTEAKAVIGVRTPLVQPPEDLPALRDALAAEFPQAEAIVDRALRPLAGQETTRLPRLLLVGPPGCGKTRLARRLGEGLGLAPSLHPAAGTSDGMFGGTPRGWSSAKFCAPFKDLVSAGIANPMIIVDEVEKAGSSRHNGALHDVLLGMLEVESSSRYRDPFLEHAVDLSRINWCFTANSLQGIPQPLLDRLVVVHVPEPGPEHLDALAPQLLDAARAELGLDEAWVPALDPVELDALRTAWSGGSLRRLRRLVDGVLAAREQSAPRQ
ncbi:AAA family ATPase [Methylobacterium sp. WL6]|uniref:AAA family ATPase n=1 Tax=Methylobacterium sp. WL6 TaxID=2603901 RepID=UPI0011C72A0B|nr:AAA family ATPase [Methylobacterium sp. WL6]TXN63215.1 AAA family ATPase [Methylobacterium sp. WL6]